MTPTDDPFAEDLEARVEAAFAADARALRRVRDNVTSEFRARAATGLGDGSRGPRWTARVRLSGALGLAFVLAMLGVGLVAAESGPGQPFYGLRLAAEELTLPAPGVARVQSQLARLEARLAEMQQGIQAGDAGAVVAALAAYRAELAEALVDGQAADDQTASLLAALTKHQDVLTALQSVLPEAAQRGIAEALEQVGTAVEQLQAGGSSGPPGSVPGSGGPPTGGPVETAHPTAPATGKPASPGPPGSTPPGQEHRPTFSPGPP